jgi:hypothetical protein
MFHNVGSALYKNEIWIMVSAGVCAYRIEAYDFALLDFDS